MYNINHCVSVKSVLGVKSKKNSQWKKSACTMHFLLRQPKMGAPLVAELSIYYGECFTSRILPPVYFFIYVCCFFFFLQSCQDFVQDIWQKPTNIWLGKPSPYSTYSSTTFLDWWTSSNGTRKKAVLYFLSKIFQKAFYKPWPRKEIADGDIFYSWLTTIYKHTVMININTIFFSQLKYALRNTQGTAVFSLFADFQLSIVCNF